MDAGHPPEIGALETLGRAYLEGELRQEPLRGEFRPSRREDVTHVGALEAAERRAAIGRGLDALRRGEVAFGVLAAGASTRMDPREMPPAARRLLERVGRREVKSKAMVPVVEVDGRVLTFLDVFLLNCARLGDETKTACPVLLLVSEANAGEIESYLEAQGGFGLSVLTFRQTLDRQIVATAEDVERARKNFASAKDVEAALDLSRRFAGHSLEVRKPAGHGEFFHQLVSSGTLGKLVDRGVRWLTIRNIDNVGATLDGDWLAILGRMIERGKLFTVEVSRRPDGPAGKGGALILRPGGALEIAEDPSFEGTGRNARESYYINNATAVADLRYLFRIYETSGEELRSASGADLAAIAERGRRKFPPLLDVKPVRLSSGRVAGAFVRETNLWESTGVARGQGVDAVGVLSVKDVEEGFDGRAAEEQRALALRVRFLAAKKWEDYEGINARLVPHVARRILSGPLVESGAA